MLDKFKNMGWKKFYLIYAMCTALKNVNVTIYSYGLPELIAIIVTVFLHKWKRQMLVSIAGGTICYMLLVQLVREILLIGR